MRRREFIALLGGAVWPPPARAQQAGKVPRIGFLGLSSPAAFASRIDALKAGLRDFGYIEGTSITIEYRWAGGHYDRLPELAAELVHSNVDIIVTHATPGSLAAKQATATIPIVVALIGDPVAAGIVLSVAHPGGNITGQSFFNAELRAKRIELLKEVKPQLTQAAVLMNPDNQAAESEFRAMEATAQSLNVKLRPFRLRAPNEFAGAFDAMEQMHLEAVETGEDQLSVANMGTIVSRATKGRMLSIGPEDVVRSGGLMSYGVDSAATYRRAAFFVDRILKGANPGDLPIERATKFQFILNRKVAQTLNLDVPTATLLRADEVIE